MIVWTASTSVSEGEAVLVCLGPRPYMHEIGAHILHYFLYTTH